MLIYQKCGCGCEVRPLQIGGACVRPKIGSQLTPCFFLVIKLDIIAYYWYGFKEYFIYMKKNLQSSQVDPEIEIEMVSRKEAFL